MCVLGVNVWLAIGGAIAFAFASYNIIILEAGHITKAYVIAYMPLVISGMLLLFKKNFLWGSVLFTLGIAMSVFENHLQITYYLMFTGIFIYLGYAWMMFKSRTVRNLVNVSVLMLACVILAVLPNAGNMYSNLEMSKTSLRGPTELTTMTASGEKISSGLEKSYAFEWSYGKSELLTLLVPNAYGGSTGGFLGKDSELYKELKAKGAQVGNEIQTYTYWGDKMFTSGPVYFGALVCLLFVFGMFVVRNPIKWWLFAISVFFVFLALGKNFDSFNTFLFHHLPLYNKFRTPEMALVIPGLIFPIIGFWGLTDLFSKKVDDKTFRQGLITSFAITGGLCLILWLVPSVFLDFRSSYDAQYQLPDWYYNALLLDRATLASSDAFRSLLFVLIGAGLLFWYHKAKDRNKTALIISACVAILILIDLWTVDRRYINDKSFTNEKLYESYKPSVADNEILKDKDLSYRVLNLNNPFQETHTAFFHKSIGGYHPAKLRRYGELIDHRLSFEINSLMNSFQHATTENDILTVFANCPSLNMLNTRYLIFNSDVPPIRNPFAYGNAWFVENIQLVDNPDAEMEALNSINPHVTAVVDKRFADEVSKFNYILDSTAIIKLESYRPNKMKYTANTSTEQLAVFSEIYYQPGWKAYIDGKPVTHFRVDWILRAMLIPAGQHQIEFVFHPDGYIVAAKTGSYISLLIILLLIAAIGYSIWHVLKKERIFLK
jgi:hypothetical protein